MLITTTYQVDGQPIRQYLGVISAETIIGANFFKDILANLTDFFGGRSNTYEKVLREGKETVIRELEQQKQLAWERMPSLGLILTITQ